MGDRKIKFGIIGLGNIAKIHIMALENIAFTKLVAVCDKNQDRIDELQLGSGIKVYAEVDQIIADPDIDVITICTPSGTHSDILIKAVKMGKHVLCEKPVAISKKQINDIKSMKPPNGVIVSVVSQLRFAQDIEKAKNIIKNGHLGDILGVNLIMNYYRSEGYYINSPWHGQKDIDGGGALMNQGIHGVDLLLYILGKDAGYPNCVAAKTHTKKHMIDVEDWVNVIIEFGNGISGFIQASTCSFPGLPRKIEVYGAKGTLILTENEITGLHTTTGDTTEVNDDRKIDVQKPFSDPQSLQINGHVQQISDLISAIQGIKPVNIPLDDGLKTVQLILDIYQTAGAIV